MAEAPATQQPGPPTPAVFELRAPVTVIRARAQLALRRLARGEPGGEPAGPTAVDLAEIVAATERLAAMLGRLERGEIDLRAASAERFAARRSPAPRTPHGASKTGTP